MDDSMILPSAAYVPNLYAGERLEPRIPPMPVYSLVMAEKLLGRFQKVWDPMPGKFDVARSLEDIQVAEEVIASEHLDWKKVPQAPALATICAPDPRELHHLALKCLHLEQEYIAFFGRATQLSGLRRYHHLYSKYPPDRIYVLCEAWAHTQKNRGGSNGAWNPAVWVVWDGKGSPAIHNRPVHPEMHWIPDRTSGG